MLIRAMAAVVGFVVGCVEWLVPLVPNITKEEAEKAGRSWFPNYEYFQLYDTGTWLWRRIKAVLTLNLDNISYYRKRQALLTSAGAYRRSCAMTGTPCRGETQTYVSLPVELH